MKELSQRSGAPRPESLERIGIAALACFTFLIRLPLAFGSPAELTARYGDDAFYILTIARNVAAGRGITIDGVHLSNGFQPLIAALYSAAFWLANDSWTAVRITVILNAAITAACVPVLAQVARRLTPDTVMKFWKKPALIAAFLWTGSISIFHQTTTGLETALYSLMLLLVLREYLRVDRSAWRLGVLLGLAVLARIDAAILVALLVAFELRHRALRRAVIIGGSALLLSLPWWLFNLVNFGSVMPTSGQAEISWPTSLEEQVARLIQTINDILIVMIYTPHDSTLTVRILTLLILSMGIVVIGWRSGLFARLRNTRLASLAPFCIFAFILVIYYTFFFRAPHFIIRYLQPLRILVLLTWSVALSELLIRSNAPKRNSLLQSAVAISLVASIGFGVNRYFAFYHKPNGSEFYNVGRWAADHPSFRVGMLQSGIAGFVAPNIVNLDGKVNAQALEAHQRGELGRYIKAEGFTYLADWKDFVEDLALLCRHDELFFDSVGMLGRVQIMKRRDPLVSPAP